MKTKILAGIATGAFVFTKKHHTEGRVTMHKLIMTILAIGLISFLTPTLLRAASIDFDDFDSGTILTDQLQPLGVIFNGSTGVAQVIDVSLNEAGVDDFGGSLPNAILISPIGAATGLRIDFVLSNGSPAVTDLVSMRVGDGDQSSESFSVSFVDLSGSALSFQEFTTTNGSIDGGVTVGFSGHGIHSILLQHMPGTASGAVLDDLTFSQPVPIPGSVWMLSSGFFGIFGLFKAQRLRRKN